MYLLRTIKVSPLTGDITIENGIRVKKGESYHWPLVSQNEFWGTTNIHLGTLSDISKCPEINEKEFLLSYTSAFFVTNLKNTLKTIDLNVSCYEKHVKGILVFTESAHNAETNGTILFQTNSKMITVLKNGQFLKFDDKKVIATEDQLLLV